MMLFGSWYTDDLLQPVPMTLKVTNMQITDSGETIHLSSLLVSVTITLARQDYILSYN